MKNMRTVLVSVFVLGLISLVGTMEYKRQIISAQLQELTQEFTETQGDDANLNNQELAKQIITEVRALIEIPEDVEPTVATIVDINLLRERNPFYNSAENGDHLLVTPTRAILYSSKMKKILDVVPVQIDEQPTEGSPQQ